MPKINMKLPVLGAASFALVVPAFSVEAKQEEILKNSHFDILTRIVYLNRDLRNGLDNNLGRILYDSELQDVWQQFYIGAKC